MASILLAKAKQTMKYDIGGEMFWFFPLEFLKEQLYCMF